MTPQWLTVGPANLLDMAVAGPYNRRHMAANWLEIALKKLVGRRIAQSRQQHVPNPLTQNELAGQTGGLVSRSTVANIEAGIQGVSLVQLYALAQVLEIEPIAFLPTRSEVVEASSPTIEEALGEHGRPIRMWLTAVRDAPDSGGTDA